MTYTRLIVLSAVFLSFGALQARAQSAAPAEQPPRSFTGDQYVDSQGCVFTRASIDGNPAWVPRVNRDRTQICDQTPTFASAQETVQADPEPVVTSAATSEPMEIVTASAPPAPAPVTAPATRTRGATQARPAPAAPAKSPRILPAHLVDRRTAVLLVRVPEGFERVWEDGRLNPRRGEQSIAGYIQSQSTMSRTVPRRDVGGANPARVVEPRIRSNTPVQTSQVRVEYVSRADQR